MTHADEMSTETDADLIGQACRSPGRFAVVFDRHYEHIYAYAARRLGRDLAEDVASETFLVAFDRRGGYDTSRLDARPWLYGIASNLIARHARAESRRYRMLAQAGGVELIEAQDAHDDVAAAPPAGPVCASAGGGGGVFRQVVYTKSIIVDNVGDTD